MSGASDPADEALFTAGFLARDTVADMNDDGAVDASDEHIFDESNLHDGGE